LSTPAVPDGDAYVINGQKIWTSHAHEADRIYLLARTSREARKQEGISLFLIDMDTPGISVRPIRTIDGWHHVNEVFLDNVRVPASRLLGEPGKGWTCAKYLLERERLPPASVAQLMRQWRRVARLLFECEAQEPARDYSALHDDMLSLAARIKGAREMLACAIDAMMRKEPLGAQPSALKLACSAIAQALTQAALLAVGPSGAQRFLRDDEAPSCAGMWVQNYLFTRSKTIAGGTTEVQLNVIARSLFGA
jgi:alkylation response protein AidB-like acyl-CoA dehydrogenase